MLALALLDYETSFATVFGVGRSSASLRAPSAQFQLSATYDECAYVAYEMELYEGEGEDGETLYDLMLVAAEVRPNLLAPRALGVLATLNLDELAAGLFEGGSHSPASQDGTPLEIVIEGGELAHLRQWVTDWREYCAERGIHADL